MGLAHGHLRKLALPAVGRLGLGNDLVSRVHVDSVVISPAVRMSCPSLAMQQHAMCSKQQHVMAACYGRDQQDQALTPPQAAQQLDVEGR